MEKLIDEFKGLKLEEKEKSKTEKIDSTTTTTGLVYHKDCENHFATLKNKLKSHCENPGRISLPLKYLKEVYTTILDCTISHNIDQKSGKMIEENQNQKFNLQILDNFPEISIDHITRTHGKEYVEICLNGFSTRYQNYLEKNSKKCIKKKKSGIAFSGGDMFYSSGTTRAMNLSAEGTRLACEKVLNGEWKNAFVLTRPPGHHARLNGLENNPQGFCFFNNVAVAAEYLQIVEKKKFLLEEKKIPKILIVDWDVHHGDGTQDIFKDSESVYYVSLHQFNNGKFYPGGDFGSVEYVGLGKGEGFNTNIGWNLPKGGILADEDYFFIFELILKPMMKEFNPDFVLVSAGFDSCRGDLLGGFSLSHRVYYNMLKSLEDIQKRIVVSLEGGYTFENLRRCSFACLSALMGMETKDIQIENISKEIKNSRKERAFMKEYQNLIGEKNFEFEKIELGKIIPQDFCLEMCIDVVENHSHFWEGVNWDEVIEKIGALKKKRKILDFFQLTICDRLELVHLTIFVFSVFKKKIGNMRKIVNEAKNSNGDCFAYVDYYDENKEKFHVRFRKNLVLKEEEDSCFVLGFENLDYEKEENFKVFDAGKNGGKWKIDVGLFGMIKEFD